jgi:hypothetical protein
MSELREAPTRPLDTFELEALHALYGGEDLSFDAKPNEIRMLGAIRAVKQCLSCHDCNRGDSLGAFSYAFRPQRPPL